MCFLAYNVSKIGVTALSMAQAREFKRDQREGILVNAVSINSITVKGRVGYAPYKDHQKCISTEPKFQNFKTENGPIFTHLLLAHLSPSLGCSGSLLQ